MKSENACISPTSDYSVYFNPSNDIKSTSTVDSANYSTQFDCASVFAMSANNVIEIKDIFALDFIRHVLSREMRP